MPKGNRTGPQGQGSGTGRAAGYCEGNDSPGYVNRETGFGFGRGRGHGHGGRGWRHQLQATGKTGWERAQSDLPSGGGVAPTAANASGPPEENTEAQQLRQQLGALQDELTVVQQRLHQLENKADQPSDTVGPASA